MQNRSIKHPQVSTYLWTFMYLKDIVGFCVGFWDFVVNLMVAIYVDPLSTLRHVQQPVAVRPRRSYNPKWLPATGHSSSGSAGRTCSRDKPRRRTQVGGAGEFWLVHSTRVIAQRPPPSSIISRECRVTPDPCSYQVLAPVSRLHLQPLASISKSNIDIAISPQLATLLTLHFVVRPLAGQICPRHVVVSLALSAHSSD